MRKKSIPIASLTTTEAELSKVPEKARAGHLSVASYFASIKTAQNQAFTEKFSKKYQATATPSVYSEVGYALVQFYANAAKLSGKTDTASLLNALYGSVFKAPGGDLFIDMETNHFTLRPHVGRSRADGSFEVVWSNPKVIAPDPYLVAYDRSIDAKVLA